jgi:outer membrane protein OmpA-like peptidoglycan-associated protein
LTSNARQHKIYKSGLEIPREGVLFMAKKISVALIYILCVVGITTFSFGAQLDDERVVLATIYFKDGSAALGPEHENDLKKAQAALEADPTIGLQIEAYNPDPASSENNRGMTQKRIQAVRQWFSKNKVDSGRLMIKGPTASRAAAKNDTSADPSLNRRVEIVKVLLKFPAAHLPETRYEFTPVIEGQEVSHNFIVQNKGTAPLEVQKVKTD